MDPVAPAIVVQVVLLGEDCHWKVQLPVPPELVLVNVALPPAQMVVAPAKEIDGSGTTVTV